MIDILVLALSHCCILFSIYRTVTVNTLLDSLLQNPEEHADFSTIGYWQIVFNTVISVMVLFAWMKTLRYMRFNQTVAELSTTLSAATADLMHFAVLFVILMFAFALLGNQLFGTKVKDFSTFETTV